jgi:type III secretion system YscQ/HrcQ family protein
MQYEPYPFGSLPKLTRAQVHALGALRARSRGLALEAATHAASLLLGVAVELLPGLPEAPPPAAPEADGLAVWVELERHAAGAPDVERAWLEFPLGLAELVVDRTLGGEGALGSTPTGLPLDELSLGALAYLVARVCAALGGGIGVRAMGLRAPAQHHALVAWPIRTRIGRHWGTMHLHVSSQTARAADSHGPALQVLAELPLSLSVEAGRVQLRLAELRSLDRGDVIVLDHSGLSYERERWHGRVSVRVRGSSCALRCHADTQRLEVESIACTPESGMSSGRRIAAPSEAIRDDADVEVRAPEPAPLAGDAPIELQLELAHFQLTLSELQRIAPGDVLSTGRRIGEAVTLRAAGRAFAQGELVDIEGEVGVRITRVLMA